MRRSDWFRASARRGVPNVAVWRAIGGTIASPVLHASQPPRGLLYCLRVCFRHGGADGRDGVLQLSPRPWRVESSPAAGAVLGIIEPSAAVQPGGSDVAARPGGF